MHNEAFHSNWQLLGSYWTTSDDQMDRRWATTRAPFLTPAEQANVDVMHPLGRKLHEMPRQLGRSRNTIRRYATDPINYGKKQKLPQTTQHPHLPIGKHRNSRLQLYKGLDLKDATKAEWDPITEAELKTLVVNMPNRVIEVIQKFGGDTKY
uniref:HTH_Tnp_Tc3_1 domain-containing protein n=1 Tax=Caenorhabditis japonica TaxID=281687 RepID=A0A8R1IEQ7_CAEJA